MVLPVTVAPAARIRSTTVACVRAGACAASHSGLPPPVRSPAMSYMSLTSAVRPARGPLALPAIGAARSCGTRKDVFIGMSSEDGSPHGAQRNAGSAVPDCGLRHLPAIPVENFFAIPGGDAGARKDRLEGALDVADAVRHAGEVRMHRDRHEFRPRHRLGIEPL